MEPDIQDSADAIELVHVQGNVEFKDVSFKYKKDYKSVLNNISLDIRVGEYIALVGSSGIGKSTLCSLIPLSLHSSVRSCLMAIPLSLLSTQSFG